MVDPMSPEDLARWREAAGGTMGMSSPTTPPPTQPPPGTPAPPPPGPGYWWNGYQWVAPVPVQRPKPKNPPFAVALGVVVAIGVGIWLFTFHESSKSKADDEKFAAYDICQTFVKDRTGGGSFPNYYVGGVTVTGDGQGPFDVTSTVTQDGADTLFDCSVTDTGTTADSKHWVLNSINIG